MKGRGPNTVGYSLQHMKYGPNELQFVRIRSALHINF